ncbi:MAG: NTP transferase domain-containing protein, partial [Ignavibacteriaceae bacterium]|nr:NTP transferase domain-containing protein [Ignavibacteriaceae bacterium]
MKILGIIPARFGSTRFPGKPLVDIDGKTMIQRVYEQAKQTALLSDVVVATDDDRIFNEVNRFGGKAVMTSPNHQSGTDRCAEVVNKLTEQYDVVINIQGDEPFINPKT